MRSASVSAAGRPRSGVPGRGDARRHQCHGPGGAHQTPGRRPRRSSRRSGPLSAERWAWLPNPSCNRRSRHARKTDLGDVARIADLDGLRVDLAGRHKATASAGATVDPAVVDDDLAAVEREGYVVLPGSHHWTPAVGPGDRDTRLPAVMPPGSCVFFVGTLWHGGGANQSGRDRLASTRSTANRGYAPKKRSPCPPAATRSARCPRTSVGCWATASTRRSSAWSTACTPNVSWTHKAGSSPDRVTTCPAALGHTCDDRRARHAGPTEDRRQ
jgi:hypothetical protein